MLISLINLFKFTGSPSIYPTASFICQLNYCYIKQFFILAFALSVSRQYFGESIICNSLEARIPVDLVRYTCFINGTYTLGNDTNEIYYHGYYQWVSFYFLFLAFAFYAPYQTFSHWLTRPVPICDNKTQYEEVIAYLFQPTCHRHVFVKTLFIEIFYFLGLLPTVAIITYLFLGGRLWIQSESIDRLFPLNGKCAITYFSGGGETSAVFHCLLPVNVVHRLVFKIAVHAFWIVFALHFLAIFYKVILYFFPVLRRTTLKNIDIWWTYRIIESNTQGENLWRLKKAFRKRRVCSITLKDMEIAGIPTVS